MFASYSSTKHVKPTHRKPRIKVISSKVRLHRPARPRSQVCHKSDKTPAIKEVTFATEPKKTVDLRARDTFQEMVEKLNEPISYARHESNGTRRGPRTSASRSRIPEPKRPVDFKKIYPPQEMEEKISKPNPYQRDRSIKTGRCPQTTAIHSLIPDSGIAGARTNFSRSFPPNTVVRVRRGRSSDQRQKPTHSSVFRQKIKQVSSPRRTTKDLQVDILCGNGKAGRIIPVHKAIPKFPIRERPAACPVKRSLDVAAKNVLNGPFLTFFKEKVSLSKEDISENSVSVNNILPQILDEIRKRDERFALRILNTGSYYEHLKVSRPVEFDVMLVFDAHLLAKFFKMKCALRDPCVGFARLEFNDHVTGGRKLWGEFLTRDGKCLSPRKTAEHFYQLVCKAVAAMRAAQRRRISDLILNGAAVTLTIDRKIDLDLVLSVEISGWPSCANAWGVFASNKTWPTKTEVEQIKIKEKRVHLVAKPCPGEKRTRDDSQVYWRISFSEAEKILLRPASSGCEKKYYRIAKAIFEACKEDLKPLSSYHLKTLFLHLRRASPQARSDDSNLGESVVKFFARLIDRLKGGHLPHFFVGPRVSLFSEMSGRTRTNLACQLEYFLNKLVENPGKFLSSLTI